MTETSLLQAIETMMDRKLEPIRKQMPLCAPLDVNLFTADRSVTDPLETLPATLEEARSLARQSKFIQEFIPEIL